MSETARTPEEIRADIEHTREELADTAAALADKADVKARAHEKVAETKAKLTGKVDGAKQKASDATPDTVAAGAQQAAGTATTKAKQNPIPVSLIAGFALGVVVGRIVWSRR